MALTNGMSKMESSGQLIIKACYGEDIRRIPIHNDDLTYDELVLMMQRVYRGVIPADQELALKYKDEDGDLVSLADTNDLSYAIQYSRVLRLTILQQGSADVKTNSVDLGIIKELRAIRDKVNRVLDLVTVQNTSDDNTADMKTEKEEEETEAFSQLQLEQSREFDPLEQSQPETTEKSRQMSGQSSQSGSGGQSTQQYPGYSPAPAGVFPPSGPQANYGQQPGQTNYQPVGGPGNYGPPPTSTAGYSQPPAGPPVSAATAATFPGGPPTSAPSNPPPAAQTFQQAGATSSAPAYPPSSAPSYPAGGATSSAPTYQPSGQPSSAPTYPPSGPPTSAPNYPPTSAPSYPPSGPPTSAPTYPPGGPPSSAPTYPPSGPPTGPPSAGQQGGYQNYPGYPQSSGYPGYQPQQFGAAASNPYSRGGVRPQ